MYRFVIPPVLVLALAGSMVLGDRMLGSPELVKPPFTWVGAAFVVVGLAIANAHARMFRRLQLNIQTFGEPSGICERGLFAYTRNPMYLGMLLVLLGAAWWIGSAVAFGGPVVFFLAAQYWYIPFEERQLRRKYGSQYDDYCRRVPRWVGPRRGDGPCCA